MHDKLKVGSLVWFQDDLETVFMDSKSGFGIILFSDLILTKMYFIESMTYETFHTRDILESSNVEFI